MADPETYEAQLERYTAMRARRAGDPANGVPGATLQQLADEFRMSRERARQIVSGLAPMPDGYRRTGDGVDMPTTRIRTRLEARIAKWENMPGPVAAARVAKLREELAKIEQQT